MTAHKTRVGTKTVPTLKRISYLLTILEISSAKFSSRFAIPSPFSKRTKPVSLMEAVKLELTKLVDITEDGKVIKVPFYSVLAKKIVADAVKNDKASRKLIMEYLAKEDLQLSKKVLEEREADKNKEDLIPEENRRAIVNMLNQYYMELVEAEERENGDLGSS